MGGPSTPRENAFKEYDHFLYADMAKLIELSISQVFFPNIGFETNLQAEKVFDFLGYNFN